MRTHLILTKAHRMRHCHYCTQPAPVAFYMPTYSTPGKPAWACVDCYIEHAVQPAVRTPSVELAHVS
jgi:hypothetical protein